MRKAFKCVETKCKKEKDTQYKTRKQLIANEKNEENMKKIYLKQFQSKEMKNVNNCYAKNCPDFITLSIQDYNKMSTSICDTEKKNQKLKKQMCKFASEVQKILKKKIITGDDKTALTFKFNKLHS